MERPPVRLGRDVPGDTHEAHQSLVPGLHDVLHRPTGTEGPIHVRRALDAVELPQVQVVRSQALEASFEVAARALRAPVAGRVGLRHEEDLRPHLAQRRSEPSLRLASLVALRRVEEADALLQRRGHQAARLPLGRGTTDVVSARAENGDLEIRAPQAPRGKGAGGAEDSPDRRLRCPSSAGDATYGARPSACGDIRQVATSGAARPEKTREACSDGTGPGDEPGDRSGEGPAVEHGPPWSARNVRACRAEVRAGRPSPRPFS